MFGLALKIMHLALCVLALALFCVGGEHACVPMPGGAENVSLGAVKRPKISLVLAVPGKACGSLTAALQTAWARLPGPDAFTLFREQSGRLAGAGLAAPAPRQIPHPPEAQAAGVVRLLI